MKDKDARDSMLDRRQAVVSAATIAAAMIAPASAQGQQRMIVDAIGLHALVKWPVERVVIASHYAYEDFTAIAGIDGWSKVVGFAREPWEDWRKATYAEYAKVIPNLASLPDVGTLGLEFDVDKVIALKPDAVLIDAFPGSLIGEKTRALRAADIPIIFFNFQAETPAKHTASTAAIGRVMGTETRAGALIQLYETLYQNVMDRIAQVEPFTKSIYAELAEEGPETIGFTDSERLWGRMALQLNALNIAQDKVPDYGGPLPTEALLAADPDLIFFAGSSWPPYRKGVRLGYGVDAATTRATLASYAARPGYDRLKAVKSGAIHAIEHSLAWSLRDVYAMQYMAKQLYPDQFTDIDPVKGLAEFHARFLPVQFSGTWLTSLR